MVLVKREIHRSVENREPQISPYKSGWFIFDRGVKASLNIFHGENVILSTNGAGRLDVYMQKKKKRKKIDLYRSQFIQK